MGPCGPQGCLGQGERRGKGRRRGRGKRGEGEGSRRGQYTGEGPRPFSSLSEKGSCMFGIEVVAQ